MTHCPYFRFNPCWQMIREIHPVGQGAFCTETFNEAMYKYKVVAFDCGGRIAADKSLQYPGLQNYLQDKFVDILFVSHFHEDHINGVKCLIVNNQNIEIYIPKVSPQRLLLDYVYNLTKTNGHSNANDFILDLVLPSLNSERDINELDGITVHIVKSDDIVYLLDSRERKIWEYNLYWQNSDEMLDNGILADICSILDISGEPRYDKKFFTDVASIFTNVSKKQRIKNIFAKYYPEGHNAYSMLVYSHPSDLAHLFDCCEQNATCLYTGDSPATQRLIDIVQTKRIDNIQVPHHGSQHNFSDKLYYMGMTAFISCGEKNKYGHPGKEALNFIIKKCDRTHLVSEIQQTSFCEIVRFIV